MSRQQRNRSRPISYIIQFFLKNKIETIPLLSSLFSGFHKKQRRRRLEINFSTPPPFVDCRLLAPLSSSSAIAVRLLFSFFFYDARQWRREWEKYSRSAIKVQRRQGNGRVRMSPSKMGERESRCSIAPCADAVAPFQTDGDIKKQTKHGRGFFLFYKACWLLLLYIYIHI